MLVLLRYAWQDMRHDWARTLLSVTGLAVLVFSYQILGALSATFAEFSRAPDLTRNLIVIQADLIDPSDAVLDPSALEAARALGPDWVERVSPVMFRRVRLGEHLVQLRASPLSDWQSLFQLVLLEGRWPSGPNEIAAGEGAARANGWTVGSLLSIYGSSFRVSAIYRSPGTLFASLWMPLDAAQRLYGENARFQGMFVQAAAQADLESLRARLQADSRIQDRYTVFFEDSYARRNNQATKDITALAGIASALALGAIVFGTFNATSLSLVERAHEIGCLRAIGFSHLSLRLFLLVRAILQGGLAYALGLGAALVYTALRAASPISILGVPLSFQVSPTQAALGLAWMALLAAAGAWLSSGRLVKTGVASLLRE